MSGRLSINSGVIHIWTLSLIIAPLIGHQVILFLHEIMMRLFDILVSHISSASGKFVKMLVTKNSSKCLLRKMKCYHHVDTCNFSIHISPKVFLLKINTKEYHGLSSKSTTEFVIHESLIDFLISGPSKHQFLFYTVHIPME